MTTEAPQALPRPVSEPSELALQMAAKDPACLYAWTGRIIDINQVIINRKELSTLVSERDALAVRVAELEANARRYVFLADALTSGDIYNALQKGFENFDQDRPPNREEFDAGIDAAIHAALTTPESKP